MEARTFRSMGRQGARTTGERWIAPGKRCNSKQVAARRQFARRGGETSWQTPEMKARKKLEPDALRQIKELVERLSGEPRVERKKRSAMRLTYQGLTFAAHGLWWGCGRIHRHFGVRC